MTIRIGRWQLRPYPNGLCWELWERRRLEDKETGEVREDWRSCGRYPGTLALGLADILERVAREGEDVVGIAEAIDRVDQIKREIVDAVREAHAQ